MTNIKELALSIRDAMGDETEAFIMTNSDAIEFATRLFTHAPAPVAVPEWKPIETAPNNSFPRLYRINGFCVQGFIDATGTLMVQSEIPPHWRKARGKPTHWQPLPQPPKEES